MKKNISILSIISIVILLSSCSDNFIEIGNDDFSLKAPEEMIENSGMIFDGAEIEYQYDSLDYYLVVLKENKEAYPDYNLADYQEENVSYILQEGSESFVTEKGKINNLETIITDVVTVDEDGETTWKVAIFESDTDFYTVWTWTGPDFAIQNIVTMDKIINTFTLK